MLDNLLPIISAVILVIVVISSQIMKLNPPRPQELTGDQTNAIHGQNKVWAFMLLMFLFVSAVNYLLIKIAPETAPGISVQLSSFLCFPVLVIGILIISVSTIKYQVSSSRGRGQREYPTGGFAVVWGILELIGVFGLVAMVIFLLSR